MPGLIRLHTLDISSNHITSLMPLLQLSHLRCLYAPNNRIQSLTGIDSCASLIEIDLENNFITDSQQGVLEKNTSLCAVNLKNNPIAR